MTRPKAEIATILERLLALPAEQRAGALCAAGPAVEVFTALANEVEMLAITNVAAALSAAEIVRELADANGGLRERAKARRGWAQSLAYGGRFDEALPVAEEAIELALAGGDALEAARGDLARVHALVHLGRYREAIERAQAARATFVGAGEWVLAGRADASLGGIYQKLEQPTEALRCFDRGRPLLSQEPVLLAQLQSNRGLALLHLDDFGGAAQAYHAALPAFAQAHMEWACGIVEGNLAELAARRGRLQEALYYFERVRRHLERDSAPAELARMLAEQADALVTLGALDEALRQYQAALPILERHGQVREAAKARYGIGRVLAARDRPVEAEASLRAALAAFEQLGQQVECARLNLVRAELALRAQRPAESRALAERALAALHDRPVDAAAARYHSAQAALATGDLAAAETALAEAIAVAEALGVAPLAADLWHARGLAQRAAGNVEAAVGAFQTAVRHLEGVRGSLQAERFRAAFSGRRLEFYDDLAVAALESTRPDATAIAFAAVERAKSRALLEQVRGTIAPHVAAEHADLAEAALLTEWQVLHDELNALYSRLADACFGADPRASTETWRAKIRAAHERLDGLEGRLSATRGAASLHARPVDLADLQAHVAAETAVVEYFALDQEILAFLVRPDRQLVVRRLGGMATITELAEQVHFQMRRALRPGAMSGSRGARLVEDARRALGALQQVIFAPLRDELGGVRRLLVVPHGPLHAVPFHALWDGAQYLGEVFEIAGAPSASLLVNLRTRRATRPAAQTALVVGVADALAPQIETEARHVAALLKTDQLLLREDATADAVRALAETADVIHFACHGQFSADHPLAAGLKLADRWLTVREIYELRLRASIVTISGCETGRNAVTAGDELTGLVRGFLAAGATALLVSLWTVHDASTATLMSSFYNHWQMGAQSVAGALQAARLEEMRAHPHPAFWAPFALIGET